ncbi:MAG TPA: DUF6065 family protein [Gemmatimonadaceae bacterium]|nr:DUF6065 family protein [Gemmatimonadaceae bacterium]
MQLVAYRIAKTPLDVRPAPVQRRWMDESPGRNAYHCLPLVIANSHGWEVLCRESFEAVWNGGREPEAIEIVPDPSRANLGVSGHFGDGILTFDLGFLVRTQAPYQLFVSGPINSPKHGIHPLSGLVETAWTQFTFTMNWRFTAPGVQVRFQRGEAVCHFFPIDPSVAEACEPTWQDIQDDPDLQAEYRQYRESRMQANKQYYLKGDALHEGQHQHFYHRGTDAAGNYRAVNHRTNMKIRPFQSSPVRNDRLRESDQQVGNDQTAKGAVRD